MTGNFGGMEITDNLITENIVGLALVYQSGVSGHSTVTMNDIYGNTLYEVMIVGSESRTAPNNWWGSFDQAQIGEKIYDGIDSAGRGILDYTPLLADSTR